MACVMREFFRRWWPWLKGVLFVAILFGVGWQQGDAWVEVEGAAAPLAAAPEPASYQVAVIHYRQRFTAQ